MEGAARRRCFLPQFTRPIDDLSGSVCPAIAGVVRLGRAAFRRVQHMSSGFAGAQRLDERRRRRLVAQDVDETPAQSKIELRRDGSKDSTDPAGPIRDLSLGMLVPTSLWRHVVLCLAGFVATAAVLTGAIYVEDASRLAGRSLRSLLGPGEGSLRTWWISAALFFQAQLALVIFWVRSHSLRDFEGRYHVWTRVTLAAMAWGLCAVTSLHTVAGQMLVAKLGWAFPLADTWGWIVPAAVVAALLTWGLHRELAPCRGSDLALFGAVLMGAAFAVVSLRLVPMPTAWESARALILDGLTMSGIWTVCVAFLIHARYVIHLSAEPAPLRKWSFRIPRPHWLKLGRSRKGDAQSADEESSESKGAKRKSGDSDSGAAASPAREARARSGRRQKGDVLPETSAAAPVVIAVEEAAAAPPAAIPALKKTIAPAETSAHFSTPASSSPVPVAAGNKSVSMPVSPVDERDSNFGQSEREADLNSRGRHSEPDVWSQAASDQELDSSDEESGEGEFEGDSDELRGLSKKQRRKLQAQRDRDRRDRRK